MSQYKLVGQIGTKETIVIEPLNGLTIQEVIDKMNHGRPVYMGWLIYADGDRDPIAKIISDDREDLYKPYVIVP